MRVERLEGGGDAVLSDAIFLSRSIIDDNWEIERKGLDEISHRRGWLKGGMSDYVGEMLDE